MKPFLTAALLALASPALADQDDRNMAYTLIVQDVVAQGLPQAAGVALGQCAIPRLNDGQIDAINASADVSQRQVIVDSLATSPDLQACLVEQLSQ